LPPPRKPKTARNHQLELESKEITHQDIIVEEQLQTNGTNIAEKRKATGGRNLEASGYKKVTKIQLTSINKRKQGSFKAVTQIQVQNSTISEPEDIRKAAFETFKTSIQKMKEQA
jgi:hypothetical protein